MPPRPSDDANPSASGRREHGGAALREGSRFAGYIVRELIGAGGMARVYRAEHQALRRDVALKVLRPGALPDREARERFLQEARITAGLQHSSVVQVFDVGVYEQLPYLAMELLEGEDLDARLHAEGALEEETLIDIAVPVAAALSAVHATGVVHRDLKPGNIFLARSREGEITPKLVDFGISKAKQQDLRLTLAAGERLIGTPLYMAPEALLGGAATPASDQYSLGVILYECVTGVNPFVATTLRESVRRIATGKRRRALDQVIAPSQALAAIIERALELEPARRFVDLQALGRELLALATPRTRVTWELKFSESDSRAQPPAELGARPNSVPHTQGRGALTVLAALGWVTAALLGVWLLRDRSSSEDAVLVVQGPAAAPQHEARALRPAPLKPSSARSSVEAVAVPDAGESSASETRPSEARPGHAASSAPMPAHRAVPAWASRFRLPDAGADSIEDTSPGEPGLGTNAAPIFD